MAAKKPEGLKDDIAEAIWRQLTKKATNKAVKNVSKNVGKSNKSANKAFKYNQKEMDAYYRTSTGLKKSEIKKKGLPNASLDKLKKLDKVEGRARIAQSKLRSGSKPQGKISRKVDDKITQKVIKPTQRKRQIIKNTSTTPAVYNSASNSLTRKKYQKHIRDEKVIKKAEKIIRKESKKTK
jgi:hypothetical protein